MVSAALGGLPGSFWFLWTGLLINRLGTFVFPLLSLYLTQQRGFSDSQVGFTIALYGAGNTIGSQAGGWLADHIGRRATMLFGLTAGAAAMIALGLAQSQQLVTGCTFAMGLVVDSHRPAMQAMVADLVRPADRTRAYGLIYWVLNLGFALAAMLVGVIVRHGFFALFLGDAVTTLLYASVVFVFLRETHPELGATRRGFRALLIPFLDSVFLVFWLLSVATSSVFMQCMVTLPLAMKHDGLSAGAYGWAIAINCLLIVLVQPWAAPILSRLRPSLVLASGVALIGVGFGLTAFARTMHEYMLTVVVWTLGEIALVPVASAIPAALAPTALRGTYQGAYSLAWALSWVVGPILGTQGLARFGPRFWGACCVICLVVSCGYLMSAGMRARRFGQD